MGIKLARRVAEQAAREAAKRGEGVAQDTGDLVVQTGGAPYADRQSKEYQYLDFHAIIESMELAPQIRQAAYRIVDEHKIKITGAEAGHFAEEFDKGCKVTAQMKSASTDVTIQTSITFSRDCVQKASCNCPACKRHVFQRYYPGDYCQYLAATIIAGSRLIADSNILDATDAGADRLISAFIDKPLAAAQDETAVPTLHLIPRLTCENWEWHVTFKIGASKTYIVRDLDDLIYNVEHSITSTYGKSTEINHARCNFLPEALPWLDFIGKKIEESIKLNKMLADRMGRYYYQESDFHYKISHIVLGTDNMDEFYEILGGDSIELDDRRASYKAVKSFITAMDIDAKANLTITKADIGKKSEFHGIDVHVLMPLGMIRTEHHGYYIDDEHKHLCRTSEAFIQGTKSLIAAIGDEEVGSFTVGRNKLGEFYHDVLPKLEEFCDVIETDQYIINKYVPPKCQFLFYLDAVNGDFTCKPLAQYGEQKYEMIDNIIQEKHGVPIPYRDKREITKEAAVVAVLKEYFPNYDRNAMLIFCGSDADLMYNLLDTGVDRLNDLGEVYCTKAFNNTKISHRMKLAVGVTITSNLMDLDITTTDVPPAELVEILKSYKAKKRYYRLRNGNFLNIEDDTVAMLDEMVSMLRISPKELAKGSLKIPSYRALYLDKLLEQHDEIAADRDSKFKAMVRDFKTVNDADFEVPDSLKDTLRGYQVTGYRWMRLLNEYGMGGILADDMGLGKTAQALAVVLAVKNEGASGTALVVCPASLVYNWGEEIEKFTPSLSYELIVGTQDERADKIEQYAGFDVIVTSYDLLKRDISMYEDKPFAFQIVDEAQYIKNHTTAAAKAVKAINAKTRYALTGTPIENRLSELWSIFDYLMPGYLYGYDVFRKEYELPIVKNRDEDSLVKLQRMTAPFILRRLKENVLKDLPDKLEENRIVRFDRPQQQLYDAELVRMKQIVAEQDEGEFERSKIVILAELTKLRQICCDPSLLFENYHEGSAKLDACIELVQSAIEGGHKMLLFSQFTTMLDIISEKLTEESIPYYTIIGATPKEERMRLVKAFNDDDTPVFLISLKAGGTGLNLTGADVVIHYDPWWNVAVQNQATDRAHRIGQTKKVVVYKLIAKGSIEERIQQMQEAKKALSDQIVNGDGMALGQMSREDFMELLG